MIRYSLKCEQDHSFESWFQSGEGFEDLNRAGHVVCPECGSRQVSKALMSPQVPKRDKDKPDLKKPDTEMAQEIAKLRKHVEENSTYVGGNFAKVARDMHEGSESGKSIWGEAKAEEAKALIEDGIPVAPLPFMPKRQTN